jgi:hypothetical protein
MSLERDHWRESAVFRDSAKTSCIQAVDDVRESNIIIKYL